MVSETYRAVTVRRKEVRASRVDVARQLIVAPFTVALMGDDSDPGLHSQRHPSHSILAGRHRRPVEVEVVLVDVDVGGGWNG